jgi:murein DD-endopeptidase MepM/ murein hydrolase activator NlpD
MPLLYGVHDTEGLPIVPDDGWCLDLVELGKNPAPRHYDPRVNWLVRLNWGYGSTGTIPKQEKMSLYLAALQHFLTGTTGVYGYIVGNEPNHPQEWPEGEEIEVSRYVDCFTLVDTLISSLQPDAKVIPAAIAPYRSGWDRWVGEMLSQIYERSGCDELCCHAYGRSDNPWQLSDESLTMRDAPLTGFFAGFLTYRDFMRLIPPPMLRLPVHITEFNEGESAWTNQNTGVVAAAYEEINGWNRNVEHNPIFSLLLYRYPAYDKWGFADKPGVIADFNQAISKGYKTPAGGYKVFLPKVTSKSPESPEKGPSVARDYDARALARGVKVMEYPGDVSPVWRVTKVHWMDKEESQGCHHIYLETLDEKGERLAGIQFAIWWSSGLDNKTVSQANPGESYSANFPMSPSRNDFSVRVAGPEISEVVTGIGMGADLGAGFNPGEHTSTLIVFQRLPNRSVPVPQPAPFSLGWPVRETNYRQITQPFGSQQDAPAGYKGHLGVDLAVPSGTQVLAAAAGRVLEVAFDEKGYGNYVKLGHSFGETLYAHLQQALVQVGEVVLRTLPIGISDSTGNSTGPHLHFGLRIAPYNRADGYDGYSDPMPYLGKSVPPQENLLSVIESAAFSTDMQWQLLASVAWAESSFRPQLEGGLFQIEPDTWSEWAPRVHAEEIRDALDNAMVAASYLKWLLAQFNGDERKALIAYNWGIGNTRSGVNVPPLTQEYVNKVLHGRDLLVAIGA